MCTNLSNKIIIAVHLGATQHGGLCVQKLYLLSHIDGNLAYLHNTTEDHNSSSQLQNIDQFTMSNRNDDLNIFIIAVHVGKTTTLQVVLSSSHASPGHILFLQASSSV